MVLSSPEALMRLKKRLPATLPLTSPNVPEPLNGRMDSAPYLLIISLNWDVIVLIASSHDILSNLPIPLLTNSFKRVKNSVRTIDPFRIVHYLLTEKTPGDKMVRIALDLNQLTVFYARNYSASIRAIMWTYTSKLIIHFLFYILRSIFKGIQLFNNNNSLATSK